MPKAQKRSDPRFVVFVVLVPFHRLTRRQALRTGAAALAVGALRPRSAFAAAQPASRVELAVTPATASSPAASSA